MPRGVELDKDDSMHINNIYLENETLNKYNYDLKVNKKKYKNERDDILKKYMKLSTELDNLIENRDALINEKKILEKQLSENINNNKINTENYNIKLIKLEKLLKEKDSELYLINNQK